MYTGVVLAIVAFHAAAFLILLGHWLVTAGLFPEATKAFEKQYTRRPVRAILVGVFTYGPLFLLLLNSGQIPNPLIRVLVIVAGFLALLMAFAGTAGLALRIGRNLTGDGTAWQHALRGSVMLALVFITPVLGSLFLLHVGLASGFGAVILARPWRASEPAAAPSVDPAAAAVLS